MIKTFLTKGGNILLLNNKKKFSFHTPELEFIREVSQNEGEYILSKHPIEVEILRNDAEWDMHCAGVQQPPVWYVITSIQVIQDNSNYRPETSCNGGNYSFKTYHDWYVAQYPNGEWKFAFVERHSTSAEFSFDELAGLFQSNLGWLTLSNTQGLNSYYCREGIRYDEEKTFYECNEVLEKIGTMSSFEHLWNEMFEYIPSKWDEEDEDFVKKALSFSDKKAIITRLKELGVTKQDKKPSLRGQRRGGGRR